MSSPTCLHALAQRDKPAVAFLLLPEKLQQKSPVTFSPARYRAFDGLKIMPRLGEFTDGKAHFFPCLQRQGKEPENNI